jgi:acetylornithine deacetylase
MSDSSHDGMMERLRQRVLDEIRPDELTAMAVDLINISSPPGAEAPAADYLASRLDELGLAITMQEVEPGRNNVVGRLPGRGGGPTLLFSGHLDTSTTGSEREAQGSYRLSGLGGGQARASVDDGWITGLGATNMKGAFAAYWGALRALQRASVQLCGDLLVAGVVGETERAPIDQYQGVEYRGGKAGSRYLVTHGVAADYAIIGEPTGLRLQIGEAGFCFARVTVFGRSQHTWCKEFGLDPIEKMLRVFEAVKNWEPVYQQRHPHPFIQPRIGIGAIQGGLPYKPSKCPAPDCSLYIDIRVLPGQSFLETQRELEAVLDELKSEDPELETRTELYMSGNGYELAPDDPLVQAVERAHLAALGSEIPYAAPNRYAVSSDAGPMFEYGIKAINFGPGGVSTTGSFLNYDPRHKNEEVLSIQNLLAASKVYALAALDLCQPAATS